MNSKGLTIIEAMMVMAIIGFVMAIIATLSYVGVTAWQKQSVRVKLESQAQSFMYVATYNLRQAQPGTVKITNLAGEMNNSLITFTLVGQSNPVSIYLKTLTGAGGNILSRQAVLAEPRGNTVTPTYSTQVLATDVMSLYFTYPKIADNSRVILNLALKKAPFKNKEPVWVQAQEVVFIRN